MDLDFDHNFMHANDNIPLVDHITSDDGLQQSVGRLIGDARNGNYSALLD